MYYKLPFSLLLITVLYCELAVDDVLNSTMIEILLQYKVLQYITNPALLGSTELYINKGKVFSVN